MGHSAGPRKDADLVRAAFATLEFPISDIEVLHADRGSGFNSAKIDEMLDAFGIKQSLSKRGCPYDNTVDKPTNKILKVELVYREAFGATRELQVKLADYVHWCGSFRLYSTLSYMADRVRESRFTSPVPLRHVRHAPPRLSFLVCGPANETSPLTSDFRLRGRLVKVTDVVWGVEDAG